MESFIGLCLLVGVGHLLRMKVKLFQKLYLPSSVIGGLLGLAILQSLQGWGTPLPPAWTAGWGKLPGLLINIVFACLFLGVTIPGLKAIWRHAGPQLAYGQVVAWGQYMVGVGLVLVLLGWAFGVEPVFGGLIPVGFEGGHGTAGGLKDTFDDLDRAHPGRGIAEMKDLALASATAGIIGAIVVGMILVNWASRKGYTHRKRRPEDIPEDDAIGVIPIGQRPSAGKLTVKSDAIETFTLHLAIVGLAIGLGWAMKQGMWQVEHVVDAEKIQAVADAEGRLARAEADTPQAPSAEKEAARARKAHRESTAYILVKSFPLFPLCMIGGLIVQILEDRLDKRNLVDAGVTRRIQNAALDFLVVAAIATIQVKVVAENLAPFLTIVAAGIAWNVFCVVFLARRMLPDAWFERSIAEMGQSMGVTATGLLLLRVVDPDYESPAADAFAYKQILHEPFMGGGLWTSTAIPLLVLWGGWPVFAISCGAVATWMFVVFVVKPFPKAVGSSQ